METLLLTIGVFIAFHIVPAIGPVRRGLIKVLGKAPYIVGYSMISLGLLGWVGIAYGEAEYVELWAQAEWMRWVPLRSEEHTSELQSHHDLVCRLLLEKKHHPETALCRQMPPSTITIDIMCLHETYST